MTENITDFDRRMGVLIRQFKAFVKKNPKIAEQDIQVIAESFLSQQPQKDPLDLEIEQLERRKKQRTLNAMRDNELLNIELENKRMREALSGKIPLNAITPEKDQMQNIKETVDFIKEVKNLLPSESGSVDEPPFDATEFAMQEGIPILRDFLAAKMMGSNIQNTKDMSEPIYSDIEVKHDDIESISRRAEEIPVIPVDNTESDIKRVSDDQRDIKHTPKIE